MTPLVDRSAPGVRITLLAHEKATSGEPLDLGDRLIGFTYEDCEKKADKLTLQLRNHDLHFFERQELMGGACLEVSWGYPGNMSPPRRVVVKKLKGFGTLNVECLCRSSQMNRQSRTRRWEGVTRSDVVRAVAKENGYEGQFADVEDTDEVYDVINQTAETDARLLRRLAAREGFLFYVDLGGLHWHRRRQSAAPTQVLTWYADPGRGDVLDVNVESDLVKRVGRATVRGRDPLRKTTISSSATSASTTRDTLGQTVEVVDPDSGRTHLEVRNATASVSPTSASSAGRAKRQSAARFSRAERATIKLSLRTVGDPTLRAKIIVEVRGVTALLSGKYYVTEAKHVITTSGYTCELKLTRDGTGRLARRLAQEQRGERNRTQSRRGGALTTIERVDADTGRTHLEFHQDGRRIGHDDPEAGQSVME
jgi:YD repeat-containing protein